MQKFQGKTGDGIGALGLKKLDNDHFELVVVDTVIQGEAPFLRKAGMGGARYTRHCLESIVLERGGLWMPETIEQSIDVIEKIDGGLIDKARFETWVYVADGDNVRRQSTQESLPIKDADLQARKFIERDIDWAGLLSQVAAQAADELDRTSLSELWTDRYAGTLEAYKTGQAHRGQMLTALLARQAQAERMFLRDTDATGAFAAQPYLTMIAARYTRALCLLEICQTTEAPDALLIPDMTELGRTILLLAAAGRIPEASELGARILNYLGDDTPFVPAVPLFALAWASNRDDLLVNADRREFGTSLHADLTLILDHIRGNDHADIGATLGRVIDGRTRQMGSFNDEYHIDFDDGLSWAMPYEALAIQQICAFSRRPLDTPDHPALALPTAWMPDLQGQPIPFQDIYAAFLEQQQA